MKHVGEFELDWTHWQLERNLSALDDIDPSRLALNELEEAYARLGNLIEKAAAAQRKLALPRSVEMAVIQ